MRPTDIPTSLVFIIVFIIAIIPSNVLGAKLNASSGWTLNRSKSNDLTVEPNGDMSVSFGTDSIPRWLIRSLSTPSKPSDTTKLSLWKLIEYSEDDSIQGFQPGRDSRVSFVKLWNKKWDDLKVTPTVIDGAQVLQICTSTLMKAPVVTICTNIVNRNLANLTAEYPLKWSMQITNYPFIRKNTRLALKVSIESLSEMSSCDDSISPANINGDASAQVIRSAVFNGDVQPDVDADLPRNQETNSLQFVHSHIVYFSFITDTQPKSLSWAPSFGSVTNSNAVDHSIPASGCETPSIVLTSNSSIDSPAEDSSGFQQTFSILCLLAASLLL